jgi:hypothetical protein
VALVAVISYEDCGAPVLNERVGVISASLGGAPWGWEAYFPCEIIKVVRSGGAGSLEGGVRELAAQEHGLALLRQVRQR